MEVSIVVRLLLINNVISITQFDRVGQCGARVG
ncbi:MAG: hypothetical protein J07HQW1_01690 [Haloquadratum walsbyi J07HQW1]|jgi:hypothetical protein|uniref:Uncharacterized protein n=1 Tax=Haloquadratum walsbyi J07HQW1 TaxID=1238424 RepID=U1PHK7_9EURY|nr:MAG: hypothetical protein J07HQW1_01690 [Haloquadratum walsbyi J07HQW1]